MSAEFIKVRGHIKVELNGVVILDRPNVVTNAGKAAIATLFNGTTAGNSLVTHMAFGSGTTAAAASQTALVTELSGGGYARQAVTRSVPTAGTIQYIATLTGLTTAVTVQEAGLFNAATAGTLFARQLTGPVSLASASDSLQITWTITFE